MFNCKKTNRKKKNIHSSGKTTAPFSFLEKVEKDNFEWGTEFDPCVPPSKLSFSTGRCAELLPNSHQYSGHSWQQPMRRWRFSALDWSRGGGVEQRSRQGTAHNGHWSSQVESSGRVISWLCHVIQWKSSLAICLCFEQIENSRFKRWSLGCVVVRKRWVCV